MSPLAYLPRFRKIENALSQLRDRESWSREQISAYQLKRLNVMWSHARSACTHYRRDAYADVPRRFDSIEHFSRTVPPLDKRVVRDQAVEFLSGQAQPGGWFRTGGSTGIPTAVYWSRIAHFEMQRAKYRGEQAFGVNVFDRKVFLWGHSGSFAPGLPGVIQRFRQPIEDRLRSRLRISAYDLSPDRLRRVLPSIANFKPSSLYGYSSAVDLLSEAVADRGPIESMRLAILTAEPTDAAMRHRIETNLGCPVTIEYGSVECGLIAYRMPDGRLRTRDDLSIVETEPVGDGRYEILVTVLNNPSFPLLRYRIGDMTLDPRRQDDIGFGYLSEVHGRSNDFLITVRGDRIHPMAVKHALEHWREIRRFTAKQAADGSLSVLVETTSQLSRSVDAELRRSLGELLGGYEVSIETTSQIDGNRAGKHRWIISDLASTKSQSR